MPASAIWCLSALLIILGAADASARQPLVELEDAFPDVPLFNRPTDIQTVPDGSNRIAIVRQAGLIYLVENNTAASERELLLDIQERVTMEPSWEEGLLGLAFHPDFETTGYFFVHYTAHPEVEEGPHRTVIARYTLSNELPADPDTEAVIIEFDQPDATHNGGQLAFGPPEGPGGRRYLYLSLGDGAGPYDPFYNAQDRSTLMGSVLRIDVDEPDGDRAYSIPADNPFAGNEDGWREEIWAFGLRNPWRFSFDSPTGRLWLGDVGQGMREEVNLILPGGNYGWNIKEGTLCLRDPLPGEPDCDDPILIDPVWEYPHDHGNGSVTGGYVYRGDAIPALQGRYVYADFISGRIWALDYDHPDGPQNELLLESSQLITTFGVDPDGELLLANYLGRLSRIVARNVAAESPPRAGDRSLSVAGPTPTAGPVTISVRAESGADIRLDVFDLTGRQIMTAHEGVSSQPSQDITVSLSGLASGHYVIRLSVQGTPVDAASVTLIRPW